MPTFNYESLSFEDRKVIHDDLAATTAKHILAAPGLFEEMPFDPGSNPSQVLETVHLLPDAKSSFEEIDFLGTAANSDIYQFVQETTKPQTWFFNRMRSVMEDGHNIYPVTPHGNIADIAFWQTGWIKNIGQDDWLDRNSVTISRGVTTIKAFEMPASEVVQKLGHVFLSFPRTPTTEAMSEQFRQKVASGDHPPVDIDSLVNTNNKRMRSEVKDWLDISLIRSIGGKAVGKAFHSAWSGKTDKVTWDDNQKPETIELGKVSDGTLSIVKHGLVLPVAIWYGEDPILEVGELTKVSSPRDVIEVQRWQAETLAKKLGLPQSAVTLEALAG